MKNMFRPIREVEVCINSRGRHDVCHDGLLMKKFKDRANEKQEVMHIHDSCMMCEVCGNTGHSGNNCPETQENVNFVNNNYYRPQ